MSRQLALSALVSTLALGALAFASPKISDREDGSRSPTNAVVAASAELPSLVEIAR